MQAHQHALRRIVWRQARARAMKPMDRPPVPKRLPALLLVCMLALATHPALAQDAKPQTQKTAPAAKHTPPAHQRTWADVWNEGAKATGAVKAWGKPRQVPKGGKPEIILKGTEVYLDGEQMRLGQGQSFAYWQQKIGGDPRCDRAYNGYQVCIWDELGLVLRSASASNEMLGGIEIHLRLRPQDPYAGLVTTRPDGTPATPPLDVWPHRPFPGYLVLDGFGIDAKTKLWEVFQASKPERNLGCGLRSCEFVRGILGPLTSLDMRTNSRSEDGELYEVHVGAQISPEPPRPQNPAIQR